MNQQYSDLKTDLIRKALELIENLHVVYRTMQIGGKLVKKIRHYNQGANLQLEIKIEKEVEEAKLCLFIDYQNPKADKFYFEKSLTTIPLHIDKMSWTQQFLNQFSSIG